MATQIIVRNANNDFDALRTAQGMENAGASVFSVAHAGMHQPYGAMAPSAKFVVFAKFDDATTSYDAIDAAIEKEFGE